MDQTEPAGAARDCCRARAGPRPTSRRLPAVAVPATDPILNGMGWPADYSQAVAGVLGISGRNLIVWVALVSKDPLALWDRVRGREAKK